MSYYLTKYFFVPNRNKAAMTEIWGKIKENNDNTNSTYEVTSTTAGFNPATPQSDR